MREETVVEALLSANGRGTESCEGVLSQYCTYAELLERYNILKQQNHKEDLSIDIYGLRFRFEQEIYAHHSEDFTLTQYKKLLQEMLSNYRFMSFSMESLNYRSPTILLRHDLDYSIQDALTLAGIENDCGVKATYFVLLNSNFYNIRDRNTRSILLEICSLGHEIGLHYDAAYLQDQVIIDSGELERHLYEQKLELEKILGIKIKVFSFHNPTTLDQGLFLKINQSSNICGMFNVYADCINNQYKYVSDSNGIWKYGSLQEYINVERYPYLHVLIHPEWWSNYPMTPRTKILSVLMRNVGRTINEYDEFLKKHDRVNY